jgi:hypothetical protein
MAPVAWILGIAFFQDGTLLMLHSAIVEYSLR